MRIFNRAYSVSFSTCVAFVSAASISMITAGSAYAWTHADLEKCTGSPSTGSCSMPAEIQTLIRQCDEPDEAAIQNLSSQGIDTHLAIDACVDFVLANGRGPANADEWKTQFAAEKKTTDGNTIAPHPIQNDAAIQRVRGVLLASLRDPDSAKFRNEHAIQWKGLVYVCGEMNSKNVYGGYVGYTPYMISPNATETDVGIALAVGENVGTTQQCLPQ